MRRGAGGRAQKERGGELIILLTCNACRFFMSAFLNQSLNSNYLEVGGGNVESVRAIGNTICQLGAIGSPLVAAVVRKRTGRWWPHFAAMGVLQVLCAAAFGRWSAVGVSQM